MLAIVSKDEYTIWRESELKAEISLERSVRMIEGLVVVFFVAMALYAVYLHYYGT